jgi:glycerol-3-phosphate acyltransferase PlsX
MRIAIDAMGGDHAPDEIVRGAIDAAASIPDATIILVGQRERIESSVKGIKNIEVHHASEVVEMREDPKRALLRKRDSSIVVGLSLVKKGEADAIISAGNTGALVGGATVTLLGLGVLEGVERPGIAVPFPTQNGICALIDAGANKNPKASHLLQYAIMGSVYISHLRQEVTSPKVGLLNIGEERNKGQDVHQEAYALLEKALGSNFVGNVEPHKVFPGKADVLVCDGFTGNIFLKTMEGTSTFLMGKMRSNGLSHNPEFMKGVDRVESYMDYSVVGGAPLLGCRGIVIKSHGRSNAKAITNAVKATADLIRTKLNDHIVDALKGHPHRRGWFQWFGAAKTAEADEE